MIKFGNVIGFAAVAVVVAWGMKVTAQHAAEARASAVGTYRLDAEQAKVYDGCIDALKDRHLTNGGAKEPFCGCFAGAAASDDDGLKYSVGILRQTMELKFGNKERAMHDLMSRSDPQYIGTLVKTARAASECVSDQQHTFASNDERNAWCGAKPERTADYRCQHRPM